MQYISTHITSNGFQPIPRTHNPPCQTQTTTPPTLSVVLRCFGFHVALPATALDWQRSPGWNSSHTTVASSHVITIGNSSIREYPSHCLLKTRELPREAVAEAASLYSRLCPLISEYRELLPQKPEFSGEASKDDTNMRVTAAWTKAKDFLTQAESRADDFSRIYFQE